MRHCTEERDQDHPHRKEMLKSKMAVWGGLVNSCEKKRSESNGEKKRHKHLNAEFQRRVRRDKKAFLSDQCKEREENNRMGKTRDLFKKIRDTKGTFRTSLVARMVKCLPTMWEIRVQSLGWEYLLEKEMATHSSIPATSS